MADDADTFAAKAAEPTHNGRVLSEFSVTRQRNEVGNQTSNVFEAMRPLRMTRNLGFLPRREVRIELFKRDRGLDLQTRDFFADGERVASFPIARSSSILASSSATGFSKSR